MYLTYLRFLVVFRTDVLKNSAADAKPLCTGSGASTRAASVSSTSASSTSSSATSSTSSTSSLQQPAL
jgi:hypothetical protein